MHCGTHRQIHIPRYSWNTAKLGVKHQSIIFKSEWVCDYCIMPTMVSSLSEEKERLKEDNDSTHRLFNEVKYHKIETCI
jgi:hypothetical protein